MTISPTEDEDRPHHPHLLDSEGEGKKLGVLQEQGKKGSDGKNANNRRGLQLHRITQVSNGKAMPQNEICLT